MDFLIEVTTQHSFEGSQVITENKCPLAVVVIVV